MSEPTYTHETTIERDGTEYACFIAYQTTPAIPEGPFQYGEDAGICILVAHDRDIVGFNLSREEIKRYTAEIKEALEKEASHAR